VSQPISAISGSAGTETPSAESSFLESRAERCQWAIASGLVVTPAGVMLLSAFSSHAAHLLGLVGVIVGPCLIWGGMAWSKMIRKARATLTMAPLDLTLDRSWTFSRTEPWRAWLRSPGSPEDQVARFGAWQLPSRNFMTAEHLPVRVYGQPRAGAVVLVSSDQGMLVGSIRSSSFTGE
jgi:hypothetical protein